MWNDSSLLHENHLLPGVVQHLLISPLIVTGLPFSDDLDIQPWKGLSLEPPQYLLLHAGLHCIRNKYSDIRREDGLTSCDWMFKTQRRKRAVIGWLPCYSHIRGKLYVAGLFPLDEGYRLTPLGICDVGELLPHQPHDQCRLPSLSSKFFLWIRFSSSNTQQCAFCDSGTEEAAFGDSDLLA